jgi:hypothetical protein
MSQQRRKLGRAVLPLLAAAWLAGCQQAPDQEPTHPSAEAPLGAGEGASAYESSAEEAAAEFAAVAPRDLTQMSLEPQAGEQGQLDQILQICGWECKAFASGNANISGIRKLDAFFAASASLKAQSLSLQAEVRAELLAIAGVLEVQGAAEMSLEQLTAAINAQVAATFSTTIEGGISIVATPPKCEVSASASIEASAKCTGMVTPGMASVECSGSCEADASAMATCTGEATLTCKGTAPALSCSGTCTGSCELSAGAKCEGECKGSCELDGTAACNGECMGSTDEGGNCTGTCKLNVGASCEGTCNGSCELSAGGNCMGECKGECEYTPPSGMCEGNATAKCQASANANVQCSGKCSGEVTPPMVEADCQATAKAEAQFAAECHPPSVDIKFNLTAEAQALFASDVNAEAAFDAKIQAIGKAFANIKAKGAKVEGVVRAGGGLVTTGAAAIKNAAAAIGSSGDAKLIIGGYCAGLAMPEVEAALSSSVTSLQATGNAVVSISQTFGGV